MAAKQELDRSANLAGIHELTENELDSIIGGKAQETEIVIDTEDARITQDVTINNGSVTIGTSNKETFGKGNKNPFYKKDGSHVHTVDLSNL